jgi:hypothetical protein
MGVSSRDEDGGGIDGDDSGGNSPSQRRAGTEILSPELGLTMAAAADVFWRKGLLFYGFHVGGLK